MFAWFKKINMSQDDKIVNFIYNSFINSPNKWSVNISSYRDRCEISDIKFKNKDENMDFYVGTSYVSINSPISCVISGNDNILSKYITSLFYRDEKENFIKFIDKKFKYNMKYTCPLSEIIEFQSWLTTNIKHSFWDKKLNATDDGLKYDIHFENEQDAILFKLRWYS